MADSIDPMNRLEEIEVKLTIGRQDLDDQLAEMDAAWHRVRVLRRRIGRLEKRAEQLAEKLAMDSDAQQTDPRGGSMEFPTPPSEN